MYVPLTDTNGNLISIPLSGVQTLRTTFGGATTNVTQYTMTVNYLLFVPSPLVVAPPSLTIETADAVTGLFAIAASATVDTAAQTISIPRPVGNKFARLKGATKYKITGTTLTATTLTIKYATAP